MIFIDVKDIVTIQKQASISFRIMIVTLISNMNLL